MTHHKKAGRKGGRATVKKHGKDYMREIGRKGGQARHEKYKMVPAPIHGFILVERATGLAVRFMDI